MNEPSPASGYRIIDETEHSAQAKRKAPWPPLGLFLLTVSLAPIGALLFGVNWARLGFPEKRMLALAAGLFALILPFAIYFGVSALNLQISIGLAKFIELLICHLPK